MHPPLLLTAALIIVEISTAQAHDGAIALAVPINPIALDGDLSDWPTDLPYYSIGRHKQGPQAQSRSDYRGRFRLGYSPAENALYVAVEVEDDVHALEDSRFYKRRIHRDGRDGCGLLLDRGHPQGTPWIFGEYYVWGRRYHAYGNAIDAADAEVVMGEDEGQRYYEWRVKLGSVAAPSALGFNLWVTDQDGDDPLSVFAWAPSEENGLGDLLLHPGTEHLGRVEGNARWPDQRPADGLPLQLTHRHNGLSVAARVDSLGHFALDLPAGPYTVETAGQRRDLQLEIGHTPDMHLDLDYSPGHRIAAGPGGRVLAGPGQQQGPWHTWGVSDGLPAASVDALFEDDSGALWIGTGRDEGEYEEGKGVVRYDGAEFTHFATADGLAHNSVFAIAQDRQGALWFGTWGGGISHYDGQYFTTYTKADGLPDNYIQILATDTDGQLWAGGPAGLARFDGRVWTPVRWQGASLYNIQSLLADRRGGVWIGTRAGAYRYRAGQLTRFTATDGLPDPGVEALLQDPQDRVWARTWTGLSRYQDDAFVPVPTASDRLPAIGTANALDRRGHLWLSSYFAGVLRYDGQQLTTFDFNDGLVHNYILSMAAGRDGAVWFGAMGGGISRFRPIAVESFADRPDLPHNPWVHSEDESGRVWFSRWRDWLYYENGDFTLFEEHPADLPDGAQLVAVDRQGHLWYAGPQSLLRYDGTSLRTYGPEQGLPSGGVSGAIHDQGVVPRLWFFSHNGWRGYIEGGRFVPHPVKGAWGIFATDSQRHQWSAQGVGRISRYDGKDLITYTAADGLPDADIRSLLVDSQDRVWVGTWGQGLACFDGQQWTTFTTADGLSHDRILHFDEDDRGRLWIATWGGGVNVFDGTVFQHLLKADGLVHDLTHDLLYTTSGDLWIQTEVGPTRYRPQSDPPKIRLTDVVSDRPHGPVDSLRLPSSRPYLRLAFQGASFHTPPQRMVYLYRLLGHDSEWRQTRQPHVAYTDLPIGHYTFEVKAVDRDLNYSPQPARLALEVFYQPVQTSVQIAAIGLDDVFASFYPTYADQAIGQVDLVNADADSIQATLRFFVPGLMPRPVDRPVTLPPQTTRQVALHAPLDAGLLAVEQTRTFTAEIALQIASGDQTLALQDSRPLTVHAPGALTWDTAARAAAFIAPTHPAVETFARPLVAAHETALQALGQPGRNLLTAGLLFEGLKAHGIRYLADANTPYSSVAADRAAVDRVRYPAQLLQHKAGDCDDLTVLYAALLENAGVPTALVDVPGHLLLMIDSGVARRQRQRLPLDEGQFVLWGDRLWIPVEVTRLDGPFIKAWDQGLQQVARQQARFVATADAWERFPPTAPEAGATIAPPTPELLQGPVAQLQTALDQRVEQHIRQTYLEPLADQDDEALRKQLLQLYLTLQRYDTAIETALAFLLEERSDPTLQYVQLGNAYFLKGEITQAAFYYKQATALKPDDEGIRTSLQRALEALGHAPPKAPAAGAPLAKDTDRKAGPQNLDIDDFYWGE